MDIFTILLSAVSTAVYFVYTSALMKQHPTLSSTVTLTVSHLVAAMATIPLWLTIFPDAPALQTYTLEAISPLLLTAALLVISRQLYYYAYAHTDVANISVFSALTPIYALATGYLFFQELPSTTALIGLLLICVSIYFLFLQRQPGSWLRNIVQPFCFIMSSRPVLCAFLSTIPTAFAAAFQKQLMHSMQPVSFSFFLLLLIGVFALVISTYFYSWKELCSQVKSIPRHFYLVSGIMLPVMHIAFCYVIAEQQTAISLVLQRSSIMFQIVLAYFFLRERQQIGKRLIVALGILTGFLLIVGR